MTAAANGGDTAAAASRVISDRPIPSLIGRSSRNFPETFVIFNINITDHI